MLALARASGAPRMDRARAARALGADLAQLEDALAGRAQTRTARAHADRAARGSGRRRAVGADRRPARLGDQRARRVRQDLGAGRGRPGVGRRRARPGDRHHAVPVGPQHPGRRSARVSYNAAQFLGHLPGQRGARGPIPLRPGDVVLVDEASMIASPDLADVIGQARGQRRQGDPGRRYAAAAGGGERRRHVPARRRPRLRAAGRAGPVPRRLGTGGQPAAARRGHHRAGRVRPARPDPRRRPGADDGRRRGRLRRARHWTAPMCC